MYQTSREVFDQIKKDYEDYVNLYKMLNQGSVEGITPFADFYWRYTYTSKYLELEKRSAFSN